MFTLDLPLVERKVIARNIVEVGFDLQGKEFAFKAGQYIRLSLNNLLYEDPKGASRNFNIVSSPNKKRIEVAFSLSESGFKRTLCKIPKDTLVRIKGPFGRFTLPDNGNSLTMIASGIGITPCLSMIRYASEIHLQNEIMLFYINRDLESAAYMHELKRLEGVNPNFRFKVGINLKDAKSVINKGSSRLWYISGIPQETSELLRLLTQSGISEKEVIVEEFAGY